MDQVKIGRVYRHFKGNYYFVENIAYHSETQERMFLEDIPERPDNITGQKTRFSLVTDLQQDYTKN